MKTKTRKLIDGKLVKEFPKEFLMTISSKCPDKWLFVDLEYCDVWHRGEKAKSQKDYPFWRSATKEDIQALVKVADYLKKHLK